MRKSILRFGALALMSLMSISVWAQIFTAGNNSYKVISPENRTAMLASATDNMPEGGSVLSDVDGNYYTITEVAEFAYKANVPGGIKIPATVTKVGAYAFVGQEINNNSLPAFTEIGEYAFKGAKFTAQDVTFEIGCDLPVGAFSDACFGTATRIKLSGCTSGLKGQVFALSNATEEDGLVSVELAINSIEGFTSVGKETFKNRTNLAGFGYRSYQTYFLPAAFTTVGDNAFEGCSSLKLSFYVQAENARITIVGKEGFKNCKLFDDTMFANTCRSFAGLTYGEGSFQGCALKNIDLTESNVTRKYGMNGVTYYDGIVVPKNAFKDNKSGEIASITSIKLPAKCVAIQEGAFENNALTAIELPEGIKYVEKNALSAKTELQQDKLFLPETLVEIGAGALNNRTFTAVYAHPQVTGTAVPKISSTDAPAITATYVPAAVPFTIVDGQSATNYNLKNYYMAQGWTAATYACQFTNALSNGNNYIFTDNNVQYSVAANSLTGAFDDNGCINVKAAKFTGNSPVIKGYIETSRLSDDQKPSKEHSLVVTDGLQTPKYKYTYPIVLHVNSFEGLVDTYQSGSVTKDITEITFSPKAATDGSLAKSFANTPAYTAVPAIFTGNTELKSVALNEGLTTISESAFSGTTKLTSITLPSTLTKIGASAFADIAAIEDVSPAIPAGLTEITLPRNVNGASALDANAFNTESLKTVKVSYDKETSGDGKCPIPTATNVFNSKTTHLVVVSGGTATREDYLLATGWSQFFDGDITVNVKKHGDNTPLIRLATKDQEGATAGTWTRYYELEDKGDIHTVSIAVTDDAKIPVHYTRSFAENVPNAWYVPFDYQYDSSKDLDVKFYYIYDTKQTGEDANAGTSIELKEVKLTEGKATIKANTPYVVVPTTEQKKFIGGNIKDNQTSFTDGSLSVQNVVNTYEFTGTYTEKGAVGAGTETSPFTRYQIYANNDGKLQPVGTDSWIPAYRFYLDIAKRNGDDTNPYDLVKFVFLDEEDATGIKDVNAETIANGAMFDLMGRQIASPVKGQVYIQNGVKKLAK